MKKLATLLLILCFSMNIQAQEVFKFAIEFTDKNNTPYSLDRPEEFLTQRSIDRRAKFSVSYANSDLPIDPVYIDDVLNAASDAKIIIQVKWMNTIIISLSNPNSIDIIDKLPIVNKTELVYNPTLKKKNDKFNDDIVFVESDNSFKSVNSYDSAYYGGGWVQIHQMRGEKLHEQGYKGQGMVIAVLDAGFINVDSLDIFKPLWDNGQILGSADFVDPGASVYDTTHYHGTMVLSTMGGYWEGELVGTAPDASYWLLKTEDAKSENIIEEYNWAAGAAFADSVGADVLNTSLGYVDFDDSSFDHTYDDLDGNTTIITRASNLAYSKGMLVVNSAGNSGGSSWRYLNAPADGIDVFTLGSVNGDGIIAGSSSHGFPWSEDVKPNVVARGSGAFVADPYTNNVRQSGGTSFSSPVLAGMATSLWSSNPSISPYWIKQAIEQSADRYHQPDTLYGYGMPNFQVAISNLGLGEDYSNSQYLKVNPNPAHSMINVNLITKEPSDYILKVFDIQGRVIIEKEIKYDGMNYPLNIEALKSGVYILELQQTKNNYRIKFNKL